MSNRDCSTTQLKSRMAGEVPSGQLVVEGGGETTEVDTEIGEPSGSVAEGTDDGQPRKWVRFTLLAIVVLGFILRYPFLGHIGGTDSFYIAGIAGGLQRGQVSPWGTDFLAYFGLAYASTPAVYPSLLALITSIPGLNVEVSALILAFALYVVGVLGSFYLGVQVRQNSSFGLVVALAYSLAPYGLRLTQWQASSRVLFISLLPIFLLLLITTIKNGARRKSFLLAALVFVTLLASHRTALLLPLVVGAFVLSLIIHRFAYTKPRSRRSRLIFPSVYLLTFSLLVASQLFKLITILPVAGNDYTSGYWLSGSSSEIILANFLLDYGTSLGLLAVLALLGTFRLVLKETRSLEETFVLLALLFAAPFLTLGRYGPSIVLPFFAILVGYGSLSLVRRGKASSRPGAALLAILLIFAPFMSVLVIRNWESQGTGVLDSATIQSSLSIDSDVDSMFLSNDWSGSYRIWMVSGSTPLAWSDLTLIMAGRMTREELPSALFLPIGLDQFSESSTSSQTETARTDWIRVMSSKADSPLARHTLEKYQIVVFVEDLSLPLSPALSEFPTSVHDSAFAVYRNSRYAVWHVG